MRDHLQSTGWSDVWIFHLHFVASLWEMFITYPPNPYACFRYSWAVCFIHMKKMFCNISKLCKREINSSQPPCEKFWKRKFFLNDSSKKMTCTPTSQIKLSSCRYGWLYERLAFKNVKLISLLSWWGLKDHACIVKLGQAICLLETLTLFYYKQFSFSELSRQHSMVITKPNQGNQLSQSEFLKLN